jgi:hypothetical protein
MRIATLLVLAVCIPAAAAQDSASSSHSSAAPPAERSRVSEDRPYGVGVNGTILTWGVSGMADVTPRVSVQASVGALGTVTALGGALLYRFNQQDSYDLFGYGGASYLRVDDLGFGDPASAVGIGGGVGIEWDWGRLFRSESFPPLHGTAQIGFTTYTTAGLGLSYFAAGGGLYYRF